MSQITDEIAGVRAVLAEYDTGRMSSGECIGRLGDVFLKPFLAAVEKGEGYMTFGSCCCSYHEPDRTFVARVTIKPHGYEVTRADPQVEARTFQVNPLPVRTCTVCGAQMTLHLRERPGGPPGNFYACTVCNP
jgi:hypothetical protein